MAGTTKSGFDGSWSLHEKGAHGKYYAVAKPMTFFEPNGDQVNCLKGRSKNKKVS